MSLMMRRVMVMTTMLLVFGDSRSWAQSADLETEAAAVVDDARLPVTVQLSDELRPRIAAMLQTSATFRVQCRQIADAARLHLQVKVDSRVDGAFRARTTISRLHSGDVVAVIALSPFGDPTEWLGHEFEHVVEQLEGLPLPELAHQRAGVWQSAPGMYETQRATRVGRRVLEEVRGASRVAAHVTTIDAASRGNHRMMAVTRSRLRPVTIRSSITYGARSRARQTCR
jgi:hypothetical protein